MKRKCALYIRVSSLRQANVEEGSLKAQEAKLRSYVKYQNTRAKDKWELVDVYNEKGRSGKNLDRPEFKRLIEDIENDKINTILIWKIDRLTRSLKDFTNLWEMFEEKGIELVSLNENFDTTSAIGRAMLQIVLVFAQLEREQTGERTAVTMQYRAEQGLWNGGRVIGYDIDPNEKGVLKISKDKSEIVKKAFRLCLEKGSAGQTRTLLNELGYRMPSYRSRNGKKHGDKLFTKQTVINLLTNPVYLGNVVWSGKTYKAKHKPIIDKDTFEAVQEVIKRNRVTRQNDKQPRKYTYLLAGLLQCAKCGGALTPKSTGNSTGKKFFYYQCVRNAKIGKPGCDSRSIPAQAIEDFIKKRILELASDVEMDKLVKKAKTKTGQSIEEMKTDRHNILNRLEAVKGKLKKIVDAIEDGAKFQSLKDRLNDLENEKENLKQAEVDLSVKIEELVKEELNTEAMKETFKTLKDILQQASRERLKELYRRIIEVIEWHEDPTDRTLGHAKICYFEQPHLTFPPNKKDTEQKRCEALFAQCPEWLPQVDEFCNWLYTEKHIQLNGSLQSIPSLI